MHKNLYSLFDCFLKNENEYVNINKNERFLDSLLNSRHRNGYDKVSLNFSIGNDQEITLLNYNIFFLFNAI